MTSFANSSNGLHAVNINPLQSMQQGQPQNFMLSNVASSSQSIMPQAQQPLVIANQDASKKQVNVKDDLLDSSDDEEKSNEIIKSLVNIDIQDKNMTE